MAPLLPFSLAMADGNGDGEGDGDDDGDDADEGELRPDAQLTGSEVERGGGLSTKPGCVLFCRRELSRKR